jgi:hypothetical protein
MVAVSPLFGTDSSIHSPEPWHFVNSGKDVDLWLNVPGDISWDYPEDSNTLTDPCSQTPTVLTSEATRIYRTITLTILVLRQFWYKRGPYTVTTPRYTTVLTCDPSVSRLRERWVSKGTEFSMGFRETS